MQSLTAISKYPDHAASMYKLALIFATHQNQIVPFCAHVQTNNLLLLLLQMILDRIGTKPLKTVFLWGHDDNAAKFLWFLRNTVF